MNLTRMLVCFAVLIVASVSHAQTCVSSEASESNAVVPVELRVTSLALNNESIFTGISKLDEQLPIAFALESIPREPRTAYPKFSGSIQDKSVREALDWLTSLDARYEWRLDGHTINIFPRGVTEEPINLLNRTLEDVRIEDAHDASEAIEQVMRKIDEKQGILLESAGTGLSFGKPWTVTLSNCSLRQVFNRITEHLGPTYGWQFATAENFRRMVIHAGLGRAKNGNSH